MKMTLILLLIFGTLFAQDKKVDLSGLDTFKWDDKKAGIINSMSKIHKVYDITYNIRIDHDHKNDYQELKLSVLKDDKIIFKFDGHPGMTFVIKDDKIYYSESQIHGMKVGCNLYAYDLKAQKKLWETSLRAVGIVPGFFYINFGINIHVGDNILIMGREMNGDFTELLDIKTGKTIAHKMHRGKYNKSIDKK